jgi:hypothetical protein
MADTVEEGDADPKRDDALETRGGETETVRGADAKAETANGADGKKNLKHEPKSYLERILPAMLTFAGVLITGYVTLTSVVLKQSQSPVARISVGLGEATIISAESGTVSKDVYVVPVDQDLSLSSAGSVDPDGDFSYADVEWTINQTYPSGRSVYSVRLVNQGKPVGKAKQVTSDLNDQIIWKPVGTGAYQVILSVMTRRSCWIFFECAAKKVSAVLHLEARTKEKPYLRVKDTPLRGTSPLRVQIDASLSESFDQEDIGLMHFVWTLDDKRLPKLPSLDLNLELPPNASDARQFTLRGTVTDRWGSTSESFQRDFLVSPPNPKIQTVEAGAASAGHEEAGGAGQPVPSDLNADMEIGDDSANVEVRGRVVTHGHHLTIHAKNLTSFTGEIVSDPTVVPPPPPASPGSDGAGGSSPGADGQPGGSGQTGLSGQNGSASNSIEITAKTFTGILLVNNSAARGQDGGMGGPGGRGGPGAVGQPAISGLLDCANGPGRGGNGGAGGRGGQGGNGGAGGPAGQVSLKFDEMAVGSQIRVDALGGRGGDGGAGGSGGLGGPGGPEGETRGFCGSAGRRGFPGQQGPLGPVGAAGDAAKNGNITLTIGNKVQTAVGSAHFQSGQ